MIDLTIPNRKQTEAYFSRFHFLLPVVDKPSFLRQYRLLMDSTRDPHAVGVDTAFVALTFAVFAIAVRFVDDPRLVTEKADEGGMGTIYYERYATGRIWDGTRLG